MGSSPVSLDVRGPLATLTISRAAKMNRLDLFAASALEQLVRNISEREEIRVLQITGEGEAFCGGVDLEYIAQIQAMGDVDSFRQFLRTGRNLLFLFRRMPQMVIAVVNGLATGAGLSLVLASDWSVASDKAFFGETAPSDGLFPGWTAHWLLEEYVGTAKSTELAMLGQKLSAEEALDLGLVNRVVTSENLVRCADQMGARFCESPPLVLREIKRTIYENHYRNCEENSELEIEGQIKCFLSEDSRAGVLAALANRRPKFEGR